MNSNAVKMCETCGLRPKHSGYDYCGKTCADKAGKKKASAAQIPRASTPPTRQNSSSNMCETCGLRPKFQNFDYCGKTCSEAAKKNKGFTTQLFGGLGIILPPVRPSLPSHNSSGPNTTAPSNMCETCGLQPKLAGTDYCGNVCRARAEKRKAAARQTATALGISDLVDERNSSAYIYSSGRNAAVATMCESCGIRPKIPGLDHCGATPACAAAAARKTSGTPQPAGVPRPPNSVARRNSAPQSFSSGSNKNIPSNMCDQCSVRPKSREVNEDGEQITHRYCGILCYEAAQRSNVPSSTIPTAVASSKIGGPLKLCLERFDTPIGRKILLMMDERWESKEACNPQLKCIYRIDLKGQVYRRFDLALQMSHGCPVQTTYYGGVTKCRIADDQEPATCESESCCLCDALRSSFGNLPYGASSRDGLYGLGLYSYTNPAMAHDAAISRDDQRTQATQYALIQCRVITQSNSTPNSNAGLIDDSGVVFCAQSIAVIPTHLLVYRLVAAPTVTDPRAANRGGFSTPATDAPYSRSPAPPAHVDGKGYLESNGLSRHRSARLDSTVSLDEEDDDFDFLTAGENLARRPAQSNLVEEDDDFY